jgi:hypothetical protein
MGGFLGGWFAGPVRRMVPAYHPTVFDGEDARAVQSPRGGVRGKVSESLNLCSVACF